MVRWVGPSIAKEIRVKELYFVHATGADGQGQMSEVVLGECARTYFADRADAIIAATELSEGSAELFGPGMIYEVGAVRYDDRDESYRIVESDAPAPYRWDGQRLYRFDADSNAYIHCFDSIYATSEAEAIEAYEARRANA
jgi:hypothetical protein